MADRPVLHAVDSSDIARVGYDEAKKQLWVKFHQGGTYVYSGVPSQVHQAMINADSVGSYFHRSIKSVYDWRKVSG